ncbi:MAG: lytic transglycosylase domain-containing protein [Deltaproteobacteria bacterium]|nr:lytic transglycosylase domain-containing protein [Deltaproteobacteria bacterium]MBI3293556.1 lytic transglycosylase domain-containing protein [Deltaproteobacteria bacterium]
MIRNFSRITADKLSAVRQQAISENSCPNNPAIAVAATLEDNLPSGVDPLEIAALYEKGGDCIPQAAAEQEILFTRAGLFYFVKKDFKQAMRCFEKAKSVDVPYTGRPLYWLSRSYLEIGEKKEAAKIVEFMRTRYPFSFHTIVALTTEKTDPGDVLRSKSGSGSARRSQQNPNVNLLIDQVELLKRFGYSAAASRVLDWAAAESQGFEPEVRLYLAELKQDGPDRVSQISLLSDILYKNPQLVSKQSMELYFPKVFFPVFETNIAGLDPNLLLAVARQESAFNPRARSVANARGLLQILPKTGRRFRKRLDLYDPEMNIEVGSRYLYELLKRLNGNIPLALASYNAGPERVSNWANRYPVDNPVLFTDLIPFRETREYVASILRNYYWYRRMNSAGDEKFVDLVYDAQLADRSVTSQPIAGPPEPPTH